MRVERDLPLRFRSPLAPVLLAGVLGSAWQLQQAELHPAGLYTDLVWLGCAAWLLALLVKRAPAWRAVLLVLALGLLGFGSTGWRAVRFADSALAPTLEGRTLLVRGVVASLPQRNDVGQRFRFDLASAWLDAEPVRLPARLELTWYASNRGDAAGEETQPVPTEPVTVRPGEHWQFEVRLKAPHGGVNPQGFDYELWQWEQGVQATGYVRAGPHDPPPQRLGSGWDYPVAWARQQLRERIALQVSDARAAGLIAALVVGDQAAIELDADIKVENWASL